MAGKPSLRGAQNCLQIRERVIISRVMIKNLFGAGTLLSARHPQIYKFDFRGWRNRARVGR